MVTSIVPKELYQLDFVCTFSEIEKYQQDTKPRSFMNFYSVIWTRELLWKYPSYLWKLLSQELCPQFGKCGQTCKYFLLKKKSDNSLRMSYISNQLVIQCYTICILVV